MRSTASRTFRRLTQPLSKSDDRPNEGRPSTAGKPATRVQTVRSIITKMSVHEVATVHTQLVEHESGADNHYFNPARPRQHLQKYHDTAPDLIRMDRLDGQRILEFGSGTRNHRSLGALLMANGAEAVVCYEPGTVLERQSDLAFDDLLLHVIKTPEAFSLPGSDPDEVAQRAIRLLRDGGPVTCTSADELAGLGEPFDIIISNHVLEHVDDLDRELRLLDSLSSDDTVQLHRVDFRDHRVFSSPGSERTPLDFYRDGVLTTCNGLRAGDVEVAFRASGWEPDRRMQQRIAPEDLPSPISEPFDHYDENDLCVLTADWVAHRRR